MSGDFTSCTIIDASYAVFRKEEGEMTIMRQGDIAKQEFAGPMGLLMKKILLPLKANSYPLSFLTTRKHGVLML